MAANATHAPKIIGVGFRTQSLTGQFPTRKRSNQPSQQRKQLTPLEVASVSKAKSAAVNDSVRNQSSVTSTSQTCQNTSNLSICQPTQGGSKS